MNEKIKVLFILPKRAKMKASSRTLAMLIEREVPNVYECSHGYVNENVIDHIDKQRPEIIFVNQHKTVNTIDLLKRIKQIHPSAVVFVILSNLIADEQDMIDECIANGAYKCYSSVLSLDTLIHDMYVCLNLE